MHSVKRSDDQESEASDRHLLSIEEDAESNSGSDIYDVERILAEKRVNDETKYLVKWTGFPDVDSTWEPEENFQDPSILVEWKKLLATGDTLDENEVAELEVRIEKKDSDSFHQVEAQERKDVDKTKSLETREAIISTAASKRGSDRSKKDSLAEGKRVLLPKKTRSSFSEVRLSPDADARPTKFHSIATKKKVPSANSTNPGRATRSQIGRTRFKNLRHMNNAQKKAKAGPQRQVAKTSSVRPLTEWNDTSQDQDLDRSSASKVNNPALPFFFTDMSRHSPSELSEGEVAFELKPPTAASASRDTDSFATMSRRPRQETPKAEWDPLFESTPSPKNIITATGRTIAKGEILIQLHFGAHKVGDVLILRFPPWLKSKLVRLKQAGSRLLPIHFEQDLVLNHSQLADITSRWPPGQIATGVINPFSDTAPAVTGLASYLETNDSVAVWEHPDPDDPMGLLLYASQAKSWREALKAGNIQGHRLVLEARERSWRGQKPVPVARDRGESGITLHYTQDLESTGAMRTPGIGDTTTISPLGIQSTARAFSINASVNASIQSDPVVESSTFKAGSADSRYGRHSDKAKSRPGASHINNGEIRETLLPAQAEPERFGDNEGMWEVSSDFRALEASTKNHNSTSKPFIYINFGRYFVTQAKAIKTWASKNTSPRFIYADTDEENGLDDFRSGNNRSVLFFHQAIPNFWELKDLWQLLGRDNVWCYNVSWTEPKNKWPAVYEFSRLFPRGTTLLLTERLLLDFSREAISTLQWFRRNAKPEWWQVVVRPNIEEWLQQKAIECEEGGKRSLLFEISELIDQLSAEEDYILSMSDLPDYDISPEAGTSVDDIAQRDEVLVEAFIYWTITDASVVSRRFIVLDDLQAKKVRNAELKNVAGHIRFALPDALIKAEQKLHGLDE